MREATVAAKDCPLAPPERASVQSRALHRACVIVGGVAQLAKRLEVAEADLRGWIRGDQPPPERAFLESVEIILLDAAGARSRPH